jgi:hypothetical protein
MTFRSGQVVILAMFGFGTAAALFGMWYRWDVTRRTLDLWGAPSAVLVVRAPQVQALGFDPPLAGIETTRTADLAAAAAQSRDVSRARGILNVRQAFVEDSTFLWDRQPDRKTLAWVYGLSFTDQDRSFVILFDPAAGVVGNPLSDRVAAIEPPASAELKEFFVEQLEEKAAK